MGPIRKQHIKNTKITLASLVSVQSIKTAAKCNVDKSLSSDDAPYRRHALHHCHTVKGTIV